MLGTIRGKVAIIAFAMFVALMLVVSCFAYIVLKNSKSLLLQLYSQKIGVIAQDINKEVIIIESNAKDLALMGSLFYTADRDIPKAENAVMRIFDNYRISLGGGVWFEPYVVNPAQKRFCIYTYRNKNGQMVIDREFIGEEYNYPNQLWYKEIISKVRKGLKACWSSPYFEKEGSNTLMITAGSGIYDKQNKLIGISTVDWEISEILKRISEIKPTPNSFALFADKENDYILVSTDKHLNNAKLVGKSLSNIPWYNDNLKQITYFTYHGQKYIPYVKTLDNNMILVVCIPKTEMFQLVITHVVSLFIALIILSAIMALLLYISLQRNILRPIDKLTEMANRISRGEEVEIKISKPKEFAHLASTFDQMTDNIKNITKEQAKISSELSIAKLIQASSLPNVFPPFPNRKEFDIYATMNPAKEVGGDFYDFYFIDEKNLMFLIADVSGKGIPAALFMMTSKTLISNLAQEGYDAKTLIENVNRKICSTNSMGLFITMLAGIINTETGKITYINCGHNHPLIKTGNDEYNYMALPTNIVLGAFENAKFEIVEAQLNKGDTVFLYTDGLTEAMNDKEMFGEKRLKQVLSKYDSEDLKSMAENIKGEIKDFCYGTPQSDDLTMLIFKYKNGNSDDIRIYKNDATKENYKDFCAWLHSVYAEWNLPDALQNKLDMCAEEIYANITFYSYPNPPGSIKVSMGKAGEKITLTFTDEGVKYNPLEKPDPDITLSPEERPLGGLGIFMVKEMADDVSYEYTNSQNILALTFKM